MFFGFLSVDMDFSALETDCSLRGGEQRVVPSHADVAAGKEFCSALPDDDGAGGNRLAAEQFHTSVLGVAVPAVSRRTLSLFMCHSKLPFFSSYTEITIIYYNRSTQYCPENF